MATLAASLLSTPTVSACSLNPTAVISAPTAASSHIHGTAVGFNGSTSTANCGTIIGYLWKNGNTTLSTSPTFNYTVTLAPQQVDSVITVSLKVTSSYNARTHTVYRTITIKRDHQSQYFVKDHLGSPRVVVDGKGAVLSYADYYPFGGIMTGRSGNNGMSHDRTKFTGYLLEEEGGQDLYHAGARSYDPIIGKFTSQDRFRGKYPSLSPYQYAANNPLYFTDINGDSLYVEHTYRTGFLGLFGPRITERTIYRDGTWYDAGTNDVASSSNRTMNRLMTQAGDAISVMQAAGGDAATVANVIAGDANSSVIVRAGTANTAAREGAASARTVAITLTGSSGMSNDLLSAGSGTLRSSGITTAAHELGHAYDFQTNTSGAYSQHPLHTFSNGRVAHASEIFGMHIENIVRAQMGLGLREFYGMDNGTKVGRALKPATRCAAHVPSNPCY